MDEERAEAVVAALRARRVFAHVERAGVYQFGVRVVIPDGREAVWDTDGAAGLEAVILQDGELVGFVPTIPGSEDLDVAGTVDAIARADYSAPPDPDPVGAAPDPAPASAPAPAAPPAAAADPPPAAPAPAHPPRLGRQVTLPASHPHHAPVSRLLRRLAGRD